MGNLDNCPPVVFNWNHDGEEGELEVLPIVVDYLHIPPWNGRVTDCFSDQDWYGYTSLDWEIYKTIFYTEDKPELEIKVTKKDLSQEQLDKIYERVLQFCSMASEEDEQDYVISMNHERKDNE